MKALRAMLGAVIVMAATVMIFSITLSCELQVLAILCNSILVSLAPRVSREDPSYRFPEKEERGMSITEPPSSATLHVILSANTPFNYTTTSSQQIPTTAHSSAATNASTSPTHLHSQTTETTERTEETVPQNILFDSDVGRKCS